MNNLRIVYNGLPFKPSLNGHKFSWIDLMNFIRYRKGDYLEIDGWRFDLNYGLVYLFERKYWSYYIPPNGLKNKRILDVGGGCGETAKYFLDNSASHVHVVENNPLCREYLEYNSNYNLKLSYRIETFNKVNPIYNCDWINKNYDLLKIDIEGYEIELLPYLDYLNINIVLECHSNYIFDKFIEKGFNVVGNVEQNKEIFGGVNQICRWKR